MNKLRICLIIVPLTLAACTGDAPPPTETPISVVPTETAASIEPTPIEPTADASLEPTIDSPFPTLEVLIFPTDPPRPTTTPDPNAPTSEPTEAVVRTLVFETLTLNRTGGPALPDGTVQQQTIVLTSEGSIRRNDGPDARLTPERVAALTQLIQDADLFEVEGTFLGAVPAEGPMPYLYQLRIDSEGDTRLLTLQEGLIPRNILILISELLSIGLAQPSTP